MSLLDLRSLEEDSAAAFTSTGAWTQAAATWAAAAEEDYAASASFLQVAATWAAVASEAFEATGSFTQAAAAWAAIAGETFSAISSWTQAAASWDASANVPLDITGTASWTQAAVSFDAAVTNTPAAFPSVIVTTLQEGINPGQNEIQQITVLATGGTFDLSQGGGGAWSLFNIPWNVSVVGLQALLDGVQGPGNTVVSGVVGTYIVEWIGVFAERDLPQMLADGTNLSGAAPVVDNGSMPHPIEMDAFPAPIDFIATFSQPTATWAAATSVNDDDLVLLLAA